MYTTRIKNGKGFIKGNIIPVGLVAVIMVTSENETYTSVTNAAGHFLVAALPAGTYAVTVTPALPLLPVTLTGFVVVEGASTNVGLLAFN